MYHLKNNWLVPVLFLPSIFIFFVSECFVGILFQAQFLTCTLSKAQSNILSNFLRFCSSEETGNSLYSYISHCIVGSVAKRLDLNRVGTIITLSRGSTHFLTDERNFKGPLNQSEIAFCLF